MCWMLSLRGHAACYATTGLVDPRAHHAPFVRFSKLLSPTAITFPQYESRTKISSLPNGYANPVRVLMKELDNTFLERSMVACVASIGAGYSNLPRFTNSTDSIPLARLLQSSEPVAQEFASQCHELGAFFIRFLIASQFSPTSSVDQAYSRVKSSTMSYLDVQETTKKLDDLVEALVEHPGVVSLERLGSLAGKEGQSELMTRVQKVQEHIGDSLYRNINAWLEPIQQTSKLDVNIRARGETTSERILQGETFARWMEALGRLGLYSMQLPIEHELNESNSSFIIQSLLKRDDVYSPYAGCIHSHSPAIASSLDMFLSADIYEIISIG
ncbi:hypothetical protein DL96DRAFT_1756945 [Flagelloscypha sp. PMI_526]|nr:hypothetical protein DL96DRAFT_1756945 [Flagelloscypha sp. PMI_526]